MEKHGNTIQMKAKTMDSFSYLQTDNEEAKADAKAAAPAAPKPGPYTVKGEKQWQAWAGEFTTHQDWLTMKANTRLPYASTLQLSEQTEEEPAKKEAAVKPAPYTVKGEKQWQTWAQAHIDALDAQTGKANTRIPYASTLQTDSEWVTDAPAVRGEKQWERYTNNNAGHLDWTAKTNSHEVRNPYLHAASLAQEEPAKKEAAAVSRPAGMPVRGEKQW